MLVATLLALASIFVSSSPAMANTKTTTVYSRWTSYAYVVVTWYGNYNVHVSAQMYNGGDAAGLEILAGYDQTTSHIYRKRATIPAGPVYQSQWQGRDLSDDVARIDLVTVCMPSLFDNYSCETLWR
jgi:hypothetical protein